MTSFFTTDRRRRLLLIALGGATAINLGLCSLIPWQVPAPAPILAAALPARPQVVQPPPPPTPPDQQKEEEPKPPFLLVADQKSKLDVKENFDKVNAGGLPAGWAQWDSTKLKSFSVDKGKALSEPDVLLGNGATATLARTWIDRVTTADVQVSAAVFLNTLVPAEVFARGSDLGGTAGSCYSASVSRGMEVHLAKYIKGESKPLGGVKSAGYISEKWVRLTLRAEGAKLSVQVLRLDTAEYLDESGQWSATPAWAIKVEDKDLASGLVGVGRLPKAAGPVTIDDFSAIPPPAEEIPPPKPMVKPTEPKPAATSAATPPTTVPSPFPLPKVPRHYEHIRIAMLAYHGNPMGTFEDKLLKESVDLVVPNVAYLQHIHDVSPATPQMIYTNTSNLYLELYTDWLAFADAKGIAREEAFFHAAAAKPFKGDSPSSMPVTYFWGVYRGGAIPTNVTGQARAKNGTFAFANPGEALSLGHPDRFREINIAIATPGRGWSAVLEYPTKVNGDGAPTVWAPLKTVTDTTAKMSQTGQLTFDPPADWKPASVGGSARLYYVRFRSTAGTPPEAATILGRDYVEAKGTVGGTVPAFDAKADANADGYLDDAEFAKRAKGMDARFIHESRMLTDSYGQMRFLSNPSSAGFRDWCVDYHNRLLAKHPLAGGLFMDNSGGKVPVKAAEVLESPANYSQDCGVMLNGIAKAIAPKWVLPNTVGGGAGAEPIIQRCPAYFEEFGLRPMSHNWTTFEDMAGVIGRRALLTNPAPIAVLDSHPQKGAVTDARMQIGVLAYYYLLADPETSYLMFFGGFEPGTPWDRHWTPAVAFNVGKPKDKWSMWETGTDPGNAALTYRLYRRDYDNAIVLYKPMSYARGSKEVPAQSDETATKHDLDGTYQPLRADGTLGEPVTGVSLRNGEGAIMIKKK